MPRKKGSINKPKFTRKMKLRADKYMETNNATEAASRVYNCKHRHIAQVIGGENLSKPVIKEYLSTIGHKARSFLERVLDGERIEKKTPDIKTRVDVAKFMDDKLFGKAMQPIEQKGLNININILEASDEELEKMIKSDQN